MFKKLSGLLLVLALTFSVVGTTTFAQTNGNTNGATAATAGDEDGMDWGWLGLLGLVGLMGLRRDDKNRK
ncbi:MAG: WGxxGxxG family protein [Paenisporosarcina sp.]